VSQDERIKNERINESQERIQADDLESEKRDEIQADDLDEKTETFWMSVRREFQADE